MKKTVFFLLVALCSLQNFAANKFYPATLIKVDGEKIECLIKEIGIGDKKLKYKESLNSKPVSIHSNELTRAIIHYDEGDVVWDYVKYIGYRSFLRGKNKVSKDPQWMQLVVSGPCSLYTWSVTTRQNGFTNIDNWYACKKQDEDASNIIGTDQDGFFDPFFKRLPDYFSDYPELAEKIKAKKYTRKNIVEIVNEYNLEKSIKK
ncbi:MAG: hypothetical protein LBH32_04915 [Dysgonamonadaceae bacterium]|jgi:hypothetical protein|nr:hypothetical protein [Dysgonamonadaceae bacterium]